MAQLPVSDEAQVEDFEKEYRQLSSKGSSPDSSAACQRFVWALVHSKSQNKVKQGLELAETRLGSKERPAADEQRELVYYCAVAFYKLGRYIDARRQLEELLKIQPHFHQAETLKVTVDDQIVKEGLIGVGVGAGLLGIIAIGITAFMSSGRR